MWRDFVNLIYPRLCLNCGDSLSSMEKHLCISCFDKIAYCPYTISQVHPVEKIFWGRCQVEAAQSLLVFNKHGVAQNLLHRLKYKGEKAIGEFLGHELGKKIAQHEVLSKADYIVPVPLHPGKQKKRGYNQSEIIAKGLSEVVSIPVLSNLLVRSSRTESQTRKSRLDRVHNVSEAFGINKKSTVRSGKLLLIDDVVTTGATLEACILKLEQHFSVSIATVAYQ